MNLGLARALGRFPRQENDIYLVKVTRFLTVEKIFEMGFWYEKNKVQSHKVLSRTLKTLKASKCTFKTLLGTSWMFCVIINCILITSFVVFPHNKTFILNFNSVSFSLWFIKEISNPCSRFVNYRFSAKIQVQFLFWILSFWTYKKVQLKFKNWLDVVFT